jgi:hypothetical protein
MASFSTVYAIQYPDGSYAKRDSGVSTTEIHLARLYKTEKRANRHGKGRGWKDEKVVKVIMLVADVTKAKHSFNSDIPVSGSFACVEPDNFTPL